MNVSGSFEQLLLQTTRLADFPAPWRNPSRRESCSPAGNLRRPGQANFCFKKNCRQQNRQNRPFSGGLCLFSLSLFRKILFTELFYLLVNALAIRVCIFTEERLPGGLSEDVLYTDFLHRNRAFLCQCIADCASKSSMRVLFWLRLCRSLLLLQRSAPHPAV